jgi:SAM-dependent methyltransferase
LRELYEQVWEQLPEGAEPYAFQRRLRFLLDRVGTGERVLDLGCGEGAFTAALADAGARPIGMEVAETALRRARAQHPGLPFALTPPDGPLPLDDASVDVVWASEVLEHLPDTARWLSEIRRVLGPGGRLLITTPAHGRLKAAALALMRFDSHFDPTGQHVRFYTRSSLARVLAEFGFEDVEIATAGGPPLLRESLMASARRAALAVR